DFLDVRANTNRGRRGTLRDCKYLRGYVLLKQGQRDAAIETFKVAIRESPPLYILDAREDSLADAYLEIGQDDDAIAEYNRILKLNPNYPLVHYKLGQIYDRRHEAELALREYETFLRLWSDADPDIPEIIAARKRMRQ